MWSSIYVDQIANSWPFPQFCCKLKNTTQRNRPCVEIWQWVWICRTWISILVFQNGNPPRNWHTLYTTAEWCLWTIKSDYCWSRSQHVFSSKCSKVTLSWSYRECRIHIKPHTVKHRRSHTPSGSSWSKTQHLKPPYLQVTWVRSRIWCSSPEAGFKSDRRDLCWLLRI